MVKKMFMEVRLSNPMTYGFKGHVKIIKVGLSPSKKNCAIYVIESLL